MRKPVFFTLLKKELLELLRSNKLLIMGALFLFFGIASAAGARYMREIVNAVVGEMGFPIPEPAYLDAVAQLIKNTSQILSIVLIFICMGTVAGEKSNQTAVFVLVKPVSRLQFLLAKTAALWLAVAVCHTIAALVFYAYTLLLFGQLPLVPFLGAYGMLLLYLVFLVTLVLFFSTVLASSAAAAALAFLSWILLSALTIVKHLGSFSPAALAGLSDNLFTSEAVPWQTLAGTAAGILLLLSLGILLFRKWEP